MKAYLLWKKANEWQLMSTHAYSQAVVWGFVHSVAFTCNSNTFHSLLVQSAHMSTHLHLSTNTMVGCVTSGLGLI